MTRIATILCDPARPILDEELRDALGLDFVTLCEGVAWEAPTDLDVADLRSRAGSAPVDIVVRDVAERRAKVLLADMDSTLIEQECIDELADVAGVGKEVAAITERAMRGELDFEQSQHERLALLQGRPRSDIDAVIERRLTVMPGAEHLAPTMKRHGTRCVIVSGGFTPFTGHIAERLGFDEHYANALGLQEDRLTGIPVPPILGREAKKERLREVCARLDVPLSAAMAVGDGANDLAMLDAAGTGVAFRAKPVVAQAARHRIDHCDLTALLYIQGYRREEFAA